MLDFGYVLDTFWTRFLDTFGYVTNDFLDTLPNFGYYCWIRANFGWPHFWIRSFFSFGYGLKIALIDKHNGKSTNASKLLDTGIPNAAVLDTKNQILDTRILFERECTIRCALDTHIQNFGY